MSWFERASDLLGEPDPGPTPFLVDQLLAEKAIGMIVGPAKSRKTWTVLELAVAIATGRPAFGRYAVEYGEDGGFDHYTDDGIRLPGANGSVLLVLEESGRRAFHRRLSMLTRGNAIDPAELAHLYFAANEGVRLDQPDWQERLAEVTDYHAFHAIFLDPLVRMKGPGRDESKQLEMGPVLDYMRHLRDEASCAVVFVHHTGWDGAHARGTSDFEAYWESKLAITRDGSVTKVVAEHREAEAAMPFSFHFSYDHTTDSVRLTARDDEDQLRARVVDYLRDHPDDSATNVHKAIGGRKQDVLAAVKSVRETDIPQPVPESPEPVGTTPLGTPVEGGSPGPLFRGPGTTSNGAVPESPEPPDSYYDSIIDEKGDDLDLDALLERHRDIAEGRA